MYKEFDLLVFIGRFQPLHDEHKRIIDFARENSKNTLILIGSAGKARTIRNPFTYEERENLIKKIFPGDDVITKPLYDMTYRDGAWLKQVQSVVTEVALDVANPDGFRLNGTKDIRIGLVGAAKDSTSYYLKLFPQWESLDAGLENVMSSTDIRESYFTEGVARTARFVPTQTHFFLNEFKQTSLYTNLVEEYTFIKEYKKAWDAAPYPVKHITVDTVLEQSGHILLVRRRANPGKGLWALPGGHLNPDETLFDGAIRELREETKIKVPEAVLRGSVVNNRTFDDPHRSMLGRVITHAYHIKLKDETTLPKVKGSDDAEKASWVPISEIKPDLLFDDHAHIIAWFLNA